VPENDLSHSIVQETSTQLKMSNKTAAMFTAVILKAGEASRDDIK